MSAAKFPLSEYDWIFAAEPHVAFNHTVLPLRRPAEVALASVGMHFVCDAGQSNTGTTLTTLAAMAFNNMLRPVVPLPDGNSRIAVAVLNIVMKAFVARTAQAAIILVDIVVILGPIKGRVPAIRDGRWDCCDHGRDTCDHGWDACDYGRDDGLVG